MRGAIAGRYEPTAIVGRGGQGYVLHAIDTRHDRPVAIKVCNAPTEADRQTLLAEARVLLTLDPHPNLPLVRDDFFEDDRYCIVMDWIDGPSVAQLLAEAGGGGLPADVVLDALAQVAAALDHLHAHDPSVLHLDVKPPNVLARPDGRFVLVDLGLAAGSVLTYGAGTSDYLAPECAAGGTPTPASDVFALAVTAFELLTGRPPAPGLVPEWPANVASDDVRRFTTVLRRAMSTDPARRPRSAGELVDALWRAPARHNLPASLSGFVGRESELEELRALVGAERCVTLAGVGGAGKTRLALEVARTALDDLDAVWFVELAGLTDATSLVAHVGRSIGLRDQRERGGADALGDAFGDGRQLLILDNCEHIVDACAHLVEDLLRACPDLSVLATSREPLRTAGESVRRVAPMRLPDGGMDPADSEAVRLFVQRARAAGGGAEVDRPGAEDVAARICVSLDGLPLAIELAAALLGELGLDEVASQLDDQLSTLVRGPRTAPRHETLRAAMQWSYGLASDDEREVLAELSVFAGTFTVHAARAVTGRSAIDVTTEGLVDRSLCERRPRRSDDGLYVLAPVRAFGSEQLTSERADGLRARHLAWHRELAETGRAHLRRAAQAEWIDRLEDAYDDLRAAIAWADASSSTEELLRLTVALAPFWSMRGYWTEGRSALERALRVAARTRLEARAWVELGSLARLQGDDDAARSAFRRAETLAAADGDVVVSIAARAGLARLASDRGDHADAASAVEELLDDARRADAPDLVGDLLADLATSCEYLGDLPAARTRFVEAADIARSVGDLHRVAELEGNLGTIAFVEGDVDGARRAFEDARSIALELRDDTLIATATSHLASCGSRDGDHEGACALYEESLEVFRRLGHQWRVALTLSELAQSTAQAGDIDAGRALLEESLGLSVRCGFHLIRGEVLHKLSLFARAQDDRTGAARALADAIRICREHGDTLRTILLVEHAAVLASDDERWVDALILAAAAGAQRERVGFPRQLMPVLEAAVDDAREAIGDADASAAEAHGTTMPMSEAVTLAIELCLSVGG